MDGTIVLVLLLTLVIGGMMLALVMGYIDIEEKRARHAAAKTAAATQILDIVEIAGFFAKPPKRTPSPGLAAVDEALLAMLEQHVKAEHATVAEFVHLPSLETLYRRSDSSLHVH